MVASRAKALAALLLRLARALARLLTRALTRPQVRANRLSPVARANLKANLKANRKGRVALQVPPLKPKGQVSQAVRKSRAKLVPLKKGRARAILLLVKVRLTPQAQDKPRVRLALLGTVGSEPYLSLRALKAPGILKDRVLSKGL